MIKKDTIRAYALKNALEHQGKATIGSIINSLFNHGLKKDKIKDIMPQVQEVLNKINNWDLEVQKMKFEGVKDLVGYRAVREGLPELPDVGKKGVVMRFRPAPSGPLHIGHIISNLLSSLYVKKYGGKFYVIIDDTDSKTVMRDSYKNIKKDCDWIFGNVLEYINSSDRIEIYYKYVLELIKKNKAYVCVCDKEKFKKMILAKEPCSCRSLNKTEQLKRWKKMLSREKDNYKEGGAVLRFKSDIKDSNPAMRDFPLARINEKKHPIQGNKYRVWPLMNLSVAVDDMEYKMTHVIRGKDHGDNAKRQKLIFEVFKKKYPWTFFIGRIKFSDLVLSKRKINEMIEKGDFIGAEDERLPTIASLRKRGYKKEAFENFVEQRGLTEVDKVISGKNFFKVIDDFNKNIYKAESHQ